MLATKLIHTLLFLLLLLATPCLMWTPLSSAEVEVDTSTDAQINGQGLLDDFGPTRIIKCFDLDPCEEPYNGTIPP